MTLQNVLQFILNIFRFHKLKIVTVIVAAMFFLVWLFPFTDLNDLITEKIATATDNNVFLTFDDLDLSLIPAPGLRLGNVKLELQNTLPLEAVELSIAPSVSSLLKFKLGFVSNAQDLLGGDIQFVLKPGDKVEEVQYQTIEIEAEDIDLVELQQLIKTPFIPKGKANLELAADIDPQFSEQPDGELSLNTKKIDLPSTNIPTQFGELPLPPLSFSRLNVKGRLTGGELILEQINLGVAKDPLQIRIKGRMGLEIKKLGAKVAPRPGAYNLKVEVTKSRSFESKDLQNLLGFLDTYKINQKGKDVYALSVKGLRFGAPPQMTKLKSFD